MKLTIRTICVASLALSTAGFGQAATPSAIYTDAQSAEGEAKVAQAGKLLADKVRDTEGVKFRDVFLRKTIGRDGNEHIGLCGEINARNGYGAMTGFHKFMLIADNVWVGGAGQVLNADEICTNGRALIDTRDYSAEVRKAFEARAGQ